MSGEGFFTIEIKKRGSIMSSSENAANEFVDILRDVVKQEFSKKDSTMLCQVKQKKSGNHYDLSILPGDQVSLKNVANMTRYDLKVGDYVYVYAIRNQFSNCFILYKITPPWEESEETASASSDIVTETTEEEEPVLGDQVTYHYANGVLTITTVE